MTLKITATDRRHTGSQQFQYLINFPRSSGLDLALRRARVLDYNEKRNWCIETWGPSCELPDWLLLHGCYPDYPVNSHWSWMTEHGLTRIYLRTQADANWFTLRWTL